MFTPKLHSMNFRRGRKQSVMSCFWVYSLSIMWGVDPTNFVIFLNFFYLWLWVTQFLLKRLFKNIQTWFAWRRGRQKSFLWEFGWLVEYICVWFLGKFGQIIPILKLALEKLILLQSMAFLNIREIRVRFVHYPPSSFLLQFSIFFLLQLSFSASIFQPVLSACRL